MSSVSDEENSLRLDIRLARPLDLEPARPPRPETDGPPQDQDLCGHLGTGGSQYPLDPDCVQSLLRAKFVLARPKDYALNEPLS